MFKSLKWLNLLSVVASIGCTTAQVNNSSRSQGLSNELNAECRQFIATLPKSYEYGFFECS